MFLTILPEVLVAILNVIMHKRDLSYTRLLCPLVSTTGGHR